MNLKSFFTKKKIIWSVIILLVLGFIFYQVFKGKNNTSSILTDTVKKQNLKRTVLATGQVVSKVDLNLSFKTSGIVQQVKIKEGDQVKQGDVLATLDQKDVQASLTSARGSLAQAQANYNKVLSGASNEEISVAQVTLDNAKTSLDITKKQQQVLVANSYSALLNSGLAAIPASGGASGYSATITGTYIGQDQGVYKISIYTTGSGLRFQYEGLETGSGIVDVSPQPLGTRGLYVQFSSTSVPVNNGWMVPVPNNQSATYVVNYNAYQSALQSQASAVAAAQSAVTAAQAALDLKKAQARPADVQAAQAQILSAEGQVEAANAALENGTIRAPSSGTITSVDVKVGELASALKEALILQDVSSLHVEAPVSEANIADVQPGQTVDFTFDALGQDRHFSGKVLTINPAATITSGVVNYKVTAEVDSEPMLKPDMTANVTILVGQKDNVLAVPSRAVISTGTSKSVRVVDDTKKKTYHSVDVQTGMEADGGWTEITGGLTEGQEIITYIKQ